MEPVYAKATWVQSQSPDRTPIEPALSEPLSVSAGLAVLIHIGVLVGWALTVLTYLRLSKTTREAARDAKFKLFHAHQVPCQQCQFYTKNPYLKCAVRPIAAMTKQAIDCSDYRAYQPEDMR